MPNIIKIFADLPPDEQVLLKDLRARYQQQCIDHHFPDLAHPFEFTADDLDLILDLAIKHRSQNILLQMTSMGTVGFNNDLADDGIGRKDPAIEAAIIAKAVALQAQQSASRAILSSRMIFGLSGNPPTRNHLNFIRHLIHQDAGLGMAGGLNPVTVILNAQSPLKSSDGYIDAVLRLEMLDGLLRSELSDAEFRCCDLSRLDIDRAPPSRMVVTLSLLKLLSDAPELYILALGHDALRQISRWHQWEALGGLCRIKFYHRPGETWDDPQIAINLSKMQEADLNYQVVFSNEEEKRTFLKTHPAENRRVVIEPIFLTQGSATDIRSWYAKNYTPSLAYEAVPTYLNVLPSVHQLIMEHVLFQNIEDKESNHEPSKKKPWMDEEGPKGLAP